MPRNPAVRPSGPIPCPANAADARRVALCTHGVNLLPLVTDPTTPVKPAAYSQYPRGYVKPGEESQGMVDLLANVAVGPSSCLTTHCTMGYSMLTFVNGTEYRYTEWVDFNTVNQNAPDWTRVVGVELYNHHQDPLENFNVASSSGPGLVAVLSGLLHQHPVAGVGVLCGGGTLSARDSLWLWR